MELTNGAAVSTVFASHSGNPSLAAQATVRVQGRITDIVEKGRPIPHAVLRHHTVEIQSDEQGRFTLEIRPEDASLVWEVSAKGYFTLQWAPSSGGAANARTVLRNIELLRIEEHEGCHGAGRATSLDLGAVGGGSHPRVDGARE